MYMYVIQLLILIIKIVNLSFIMFKNNSLCKCSLKLPKNKCICSMKFTDLEANKND